MDKALIIILILINSICFSQSKDKRNNIILKSTRYTSAFCAGYLEGLGDKLVHNYSDVKRVHPNMNDQFCDPNISWRNKWKNGDPTQGEKYLGSSTVFVPFEDLWHGAKGGQRIFTIGSSIIIPIGEKKSWKWYLKELAIGYACNRAGFYTSYNLIYK